MKKKPEYVEGEEALENFERALDAVLRMPHSEIKEKLEAERRTKAEQQKRERKAGSQR